MGTDFNITKRIVSSHNNYYRVGMHAHKNDKIKVLYSTSSTEMTFVETKD
jgi:hypothetical protein